MKSKEEAPVLFPELFLCDYIKSPKHKNPEGPTPQAQNPINLKPQHWKPNQRNQPQNSTPNYDKWENMRIYYAE